MTARTQIHGLQVATELFDFINQKVLPGTGVSEAEFWKGFDGIVSDLAPKNAALLAERDRLQTELDTWHAANPGPIRDMAGYRKFLETIGYLVPQPKSVKATTKNVDDELATQAGPQLVVPILNARFLLNAANARWGSLYDAFYGTDALDAAPARPGAARGAPGTPCEVRGTVRGLHFQYPPHAESKLISCLRGAVWDVAVDVRLGSPTFLHWHAERLEDGCASALLIPPGFAHGFQALTDDAELLYLHSADYTPNHEGGLSAHDARLAIQWPLPVRNLSDRDAGHAPLDVRFEGVEV